MFSFPTPKFSQATLYHIKKSEAKFNLSASEFGHKFGEWLLYIGKDNLDETYSDVILFNKKQDEEVLIGAKGAEIINDSGILRLKLTDGEGYSYSEEKFTQIDFKIMYINDTMKADLHEYQTPMQYWFPKDTSLKTEKRLITNTLFSLFPVLSLFLIASIGIVHVRHQKGKVYLFLFLSIIIYDALAVALQLAISTYAVPVLIIGWLLATYIMYKKMIVSKF